MSLLYEFPEVDVEPHGHSALAELSEVYRQIGFDAGYAKATRDHLEAFVATAESVLREQSADHADRKLLYGFVARLEKQLDMEHEHSVSTPTGFVDGGLGI